MFFLPLPHRPHLFRPPFRPPLGAVGGVVDAVFPQGKFVNLQKMNEITSFGLWG